MLFKREYIGKKLKITDKDGKKWIGKHVLLEESDSGELEIGIERGFGIVLLKESEIESIELVEE